MHSLPRESSYSVGSGWPISLLGLFFVAIAPLMLFATTVLDRQPVDRGLISFIAGPLAIGLLILSFASRRAVVSDTGITMRMTFRSIAIGWDEVAHIRRSEAWFVIKDLRGHSYRFGPYPRGADDLERDVRIRRPHAISPVVAWNAEHEPPAERDRTAFGGFRNTDQLTTRQAIGVALLFTLIIFGSLSIANLDAFAGPLLKSGMGKLAAYFIAFCALVLLLVLVGGFASWLMQTPRRAQR